MRVCVCAASRPDCSSTAASTTRLCVPVLTRPRTHTPHLQVLMTVPTIGFNVEKVGSSQQ